MMYGQRGLRAIPGIISPSSLGYPASDFPARPHTENLLIREHHPAPVACCPTVKFSGKRQPGPPMLSPKQRLIYDPPRHETHAVEKVLDSPPACLVRDLCSNDPCRIEYGESEPHPYNCSSRSTVQCIEGLLVDNFSNPACSPKWLLVGEPQQFTLISGVPCIRERDKT